jgi:hypothetical protein
VSYLTNEWWDVQGAGVVWTRVERGVGLTVERSGEGSRWSAVVSAEGMRFTAPPQSDLNAARAWCDRWAGVIARELGR